MDPFRQCFFIPKPTFTPGDVPDQTGRVSIITGGYAGLGLHVVRALYAHSGTVYIFGRSQAKADKAIESLRAQCPQAKGRLEFVQCDLSDLDSVRRAAAEFKSRESQLHNLTQNAGVMNTPTTMKSAQGYDLQMGTNCLGPYLLMRCLLPVLKKTAAASPPGTVRVTWAGSIMAHLTSPSGGVSFDEATGKPSIYRTTQINYGQSKAGNILLASEFARRYPVEETGIISNSWNPGNLDTELQRHSPTTMAFIIRWLMMYPAYLGACTELFAGWSDEAGKPENNGRYIWPWGRFGSIRSDVANSLKTKKDGGSEVAARFWDWCEAQTRDSGEAGR